MSLPEYPNFVQANMSHANVVWRKAVVGESDIALREERDLHTTDFRLYVDGKIVHRATVRNVRADAVRDDIWDNLAGKHATLVVL